MVLSTNTVDHGPVAARHVRQVEAVCDDAGDSLRAEWQGVATQFCRIVVPF